MKAVRCAIYTRKSSEEGLEQDFNSLHAQREACAAYILSQASEGWTALADVYDDGGLSGGTLERPALQRLLGDVAAGRIDIIVVYKVDRLTRSLLDFSKLVEAFDAAGTSFVSVTQSFNTTTSMGRLTLNMLLSFAQFEREVTAERIRDKIAASKARGMWMGGIPPLGYKPDGRSLAIVEEHAAIVRHIFARYLVLGNVRLLADELRRERILVPIRTTGSGKTIGGVPFSRGLLYAMLRRVTYDGQIQHCDKVFVGNHPAIIDRETFGRVQQMISGHLRGARTAPRRASHSLLGGKIIDDAGALLIATHACKGTRRYRYYVSRALQRKDSDTGLRVPAPEIEGLVVDRIACLFDDPLVLASEAGLDVPADRLIAVHRHCATIAAGLRHTPRIDLPILVRQVRVEDACIVIACDRAAIARLLDLPLPPRDEPTFQLTVAARVTRSGMAVRLVHESGATLPAVNGPLVRHLVKARRWWAELRLGQRNITELAATEGVTPAYITRVLRLAFLAPAVVDAILAGRQRAGVCASELTMDAAPMRWSEQVVALLPAG